MSEKEKELIRELDEAGVSPSEIRKAIWKELGVSRSDVAIWKYRMKLADEETTEQND